jgi:hypothetical protein
MLGTCNITMQGILENNNACKIRYFVFQNAPWDLKWCVVSNPPTTLKKILWRFLHINCDKILENSQKN